MYALPFLWLCEGATDSWACCDKALSCGVSFFCFFVIRVGKKNINGDPLRRVVAVEIEKLPVMPDNRNMRLLLFLFMFVRLGKEEGKRDHVKEDGEERENE